ncbi:Transcription factor MEIS1 [Handroanthus impetiginosus]|uniref:Transcription factor MEIS1 n=1 Tax=Handroanthus impetiginosus TaxID=429701 RepID=A0A2G9HQ10_9LAMI|nr:Transcription factor MEIS1 [Handroanthus impetiginosus]
MGLATPAPLEYSLNSDKKDFSNPMSQDYHFSFSHGFEKQQQHQQQQNQHIAQQIRRDKLRVQGFEPAPALLVGIEEENNSVPVYETAGMLSEMFNFPSAGGGAATATELLETQILNSYRNPPSSSTVDWFSHREGMVGRSGGGLEYSKNQISSINGDSAAAMQLFLRQSSPSPSPSIPNSTSSTLHMLLPNPSSSSSPTNLQNFHNGFGQFAWNQNNPNEIGGVVEGQGLSLSLSSSLQHFGGGGGLNRSHQLLGSSFGTMSMLRNSKYAKAVQELLEEFCSVGRGESKRNKLGRQNDNNRHPSGDAAIGAGGGGGGNSSSSSKDVPPLSASERLEHQRRKVKLLSMLDEVNRRYTHYCEQMQMIVNSFDMVMGSGAAAPYTTLAQKAMSRHFRCLKDAIAAQLKHSCEMLGEKDAATLGVTKGETPRLRILDQKLRQQRAFHQTGMTEPEAWRPQRGLPERSVNVLRAWLFEHFLHPYPTDADKHLLARQTGLSRNQVSNWFINARVRLWKPMVEDMYQQEFQAKDHKQNQDQTATPQSIAATSAAAAFTPRSEIIAAENNSSFVAINAPEKLASNVRVPGPKAIAATESFPAAVHNGNIGSTVVRFGTSSGDVSLTLGLRHAPEKSPFSVRDFDSS